MKFLFLFALVAFVSAAPPKSMVQIVINLEKTAEKTDDIFAPANPMPLPTPELEKPIISLPQPEEPINVKPALPQIEEKPQTEDMFQPWPQVEEKPQTEDMFQPMPQVYPLPIAKPF